jgi:hypothetical protein
VWGCCKSALPSATACVGLPTPVYMYIYALASLLANVSFKLAGETMHSGLAQQATDLTDQGRLSCRW